MNYSISERPGYRDSVMSIAHEVVITHLDEGDRWQVTPLLPGSGNTKPSIARAILERVEIAVKVREAVLAAIDLSDCHHAFLGAASDMNSAALKEIIQREQCT